METHPNGWLGPEEVKDPWLHARLAMVAHQIAARRIHDTRVLRAMRKVPRHVFVPLEFRAKAYEDRALPIGEDQTISQPYIVALMTELLELTGPERVLEVGTGSGYQTAILAEIAAQVFTIELDRTLLERARAVLDDLGYTSIHYRLGDGSQGWPEHARYDGILVAAAPTTIPSPLVEQLGKDGRLVIPVGRRDQMLKVLCRKGDGVVEENVIPVRFVPLVGGDAAE